MRANLALVFWEVRNSIYPRWIISKNPLEKKTSVRQSGIRLP